MKRRTFLQYVIGAVTALFVPKAKVATGKEKTAKWLKEAEAIYPHRRRGMPFIHIGASAETWSAKSKRSGYTRGRVESLKFPDEVIAIERLQDRCFVFCENSIWEVEENCDGGLQIKNIEIRKK